MKYSQSCNNEIGKMVSLFRNNTLLMLLFAVGGLIFGLSTAYFSIEPVSVRGSIQIGSIGLIRTLPYPESCRDLDGEHRVFCLSNEVTEDLRLTKIPVETAQDLWYRLHEKQNVKLARQGQLSYPHLYHIEFQNNLFALEVRAGTIREAEEFLTELVDNIFSEHNVIVERHRAKLEHYRGLIELKNPIDESTVNLPGRIYLEEVFATLADMDILTRRTVWLDRPTVLRPETNIMYFRGIAGFSIGLILGGLCLVVGSLFSNRFEIKC